LSGQEESISIVSLLLESTQNAICSDIYASHFFIPVILILHHTKDFQKKFPGSINKAMVGFMSPHAKHIKNPTYRQVCNGDTGHVEVLYVELNDPNAHFEELIKFFFLFHDPTTINRQGNDRGTQYASAIFYEDEEQKQIIEKVIRELQSVLDGGTISPYSGKKIVTSIHKATEFYVAEESHQQVCYLASFFLSFPVKCHRKLLETRINLKTHFLIIEYNVSLKFSILKRTPTAIGKLKIGLFYFSMIWSTLC